MKTKSKPNPKTGARRKKKALEVEAAPSKAESGSAPIAEDDA
ncbi:MAG: hypothetical protein ACHQ2Z_07540 [Elusimicrobiota bacterium]